MPSTSLPSEIYDEIISYLWDDKISLATCSLASRVLSIASQRLLFYQIILISPKFSTADPSIPSGGTASSFWNNVLEKSPHIAGYVQCLQVMNFDIEYQRDDWVFHDTFLPKILPLHTNLKAFVVFQVPEWGDLSADIQRAFQDVTRLPTLVHLDLSCRPAFFFSQHFNNNLKHLVIHVHDDKRGDALAPFKSCASSIYLESLHLLDAEFLLPLIANPNSPFKFNHLRKLGVDMDTDSSQFAECRQLSLVLLSCRETLEELQLTLRISFFITIIPSQSPPFDLSRMASLKALTLSFNAYHRGIDWGPTSCLDFLLCSVSSPYQQLEEITVVVELYDAGYGGTDHDRYWDKVSGFFLDENQCPRLRKLSIHAVNDFNYHKSRFITSVDEFESTKKLQARTGMKFTATNGKPVDYWRFPQDERWDNAAFKIYYSYMSYLF